MANVAFLIAFIALPVASFALVRSLTWIAVWMGGSIAVVGAFVNFTIDRGAHWDFLSLQAALLVCLSVVLFVAILVRARGRFKASVPFSRQVTAVIAPILVGFAVILVSRLLAAPAAGAFTGVGFLVARKEAEDNAKWLDFSAQLASGSPIAQGVPMGGPLQLIVVFTATMLAVISLLAFGGVNEVFVAANSVIYLEFALAMIVPFALAPIAEARVRVPSGRDVRGFIPAPAVWIGSFVMITASLAVSGYGHLTLQFVFLVTGLWASLYLVGSKIRHAYLLTALTVVTASLVWFPLTVIAIPILIGAIVYVARQALRARTLRSIPWVPVGLITLVVALTWSSLSSALRFMADVPSAGGTAGFGGGGVRTAVASAPIRALELLTSQGGTEIIQPAVGLLALASVVLAGLYISRRRSVLPRMGTFVAFGPMAMLVAFGLVVSVAGTWFAGSGPSYGGLKAMFAASIVVLAVTLPLAIMEIDRHRRGVTIVRAAAIVGVLYILTVDSILPRAVTFMSPTQWPITTADAPGYWWPAEVRNTPDQSIASNPVGCAYFPQGTEAPTALPDGLLSYSCSRILVGLSGMDSKGQGIVDWLRREWQTDTPAWTAVWPQLVTMDAAVLDKKLILLDDGNSVVRLETVRTLLDRIRPQWAQGQPLLEAKP